jgi:hypothetical protein
VCSCIRPLYFVALIAALLACASTSGAAEPTDPTIPQGTYTSEREAEILALFNSMQGKQEQCADAYLRAYQKALFDYCEATGRGKNVGGGCSHAAYAWSIHTRVLELALEQCAKSRKVSSVRPNTSLERTRER